LLVREIAGCQEIVAGDNSLLRELLNPGKDALELRYSLAVARIGPGGTTYLHRLKSSEVYLILKGSAQMRVGSETEDVGAGQAIYVPPNFIQQISNTGADDLIFVCIVDPAWREEDEEIVVTGS